MHDGFTSFIQHGKALASARGIDWQFPLDERGMSHTGWNLTTIVDSPPPNCYLRDLGMDDKALAAINVLRAQDGQPPLSKTPLSTEWQDLIKAATCDQLLFKRNTTTHIIQNIIRPLKVLATCAGSTEPWELTADTAREAISLATKIQASGKLADIIAGIIKNIIDANHIARASPLYPALAIARMPTNTSRKSRAAKSKDELRDDLEARKRVERLPDRRAFWELIRIIFTEQPRTFSDALRFSALKVSVLTGLRIGEVSMLPADWMRYRDYYSAKGQPAGELGGYSRALMLRHFAEKQQVPNSDSRVLFEAAQYVPEMFTEIISETLNDTVRITQPLRDTLKRQVETGRLFPNYGVDDLVPIVELYPQITGNPFWLRMDPEVVENFVAKYRQGFAPATLAALSEYQNTRYWGVKEPGALDMAIYMFLNRFVNSKSELMRLYDSSGRNYVAARKKWSDIYLRVGELENYLTVVAPTKRPDWKLFKLEVGMLQPWELLYLTPKRALAEERNDGITDILRYYAISVPDDSLISLAIGEVKENRESLFMRYGQTEADRQLTLVSHSLRHLQNTELFRLGVADTIITKRFNRRSVAQSYEYDHRSLAEEMDAIEMPAEIEASLGDKASTVARLIQAGKATGPIVDAFKRIQQDEGDDAAFEFLKVEADGFHITPYGHCINSFTVDPCPKNLECFAGCGHLTATNLPENRRHLERLEQQFMVALSEAQAKPTNTKGQKNQIAHATIRLENIQKLLSTPDGHRPFPTGPDLSKMKNNRSVLDD